MLLARNRNYRLLFSASAVSNLGDGISALAFPWLASLLTRDPFLIAAVAAAGRLPWLLFTAPAGVMTDRISRQRLMVWSDVVRAGLTGLVILLILSIPQIEAGASTLTVWAL
ncbi:MAG: MFS transporter, partial [Pseudomonadota bacterium]